MRFTKKGKCMTVYIFTSFPNPPEKMEKTELVAASIAKGEEEMCSNSPNFQSIYVCNKMLPDQITFGRAVDKNIKG